MSIWAAGLAHKTNRIASPNDWSHVRDAICLCLSPSSPDLSWTDACAQNSVEGARAWTQLDIRLSALLSQIAFKNLDDFSLDQICLFSICYHSRDFGSRRSWPEVALSSFGGLKDSKGLAYFVTTAHPAIKTSCAFIALSKAPWEAKWRKAICDGKAGNLTSLTLPILEARGSMSVRASWDYVFIMSCKISSKLTKLWTAGIAHKTNRIASPNDRSHVRDAICLSLSPSGPDFSWTDACTQNSVEGCGYQYCFFSLASRSRYTHVYVTTHTRRYGTWKTSTHADHIYI